jgi:hypothetical protein
VTANPVTVGERLRLDVELEPAPAGPDTVELPPGLPELHCFVSADGLALCGPEAEVMKVDPYTDVPAPVHFDLLARVFGPRPYTVELFVEDPGSGRRLVVQARGQVEIGAPRLQAGDQIAVLPALDVAVRTRPDFVLRVDTVLPHGAGGPRHLKYMLTSPLPGLGLRDQDVGGTVLDAHALDRLRTLLRQAARSDAGLSPLDARGRMLSFGRYLFDLLFPSREAAVFRKAYREALPRLTTWLVIEDALTWLPWEIVAPHFADTGDPPYFLCERHRLTRWVEGLGPPLYGEVTIGELVLAHYGRAAPGEGVAAQALSAWEELLGAPAQAGLGDVTRPETPVYALHLLRDAAAGVGRELVPRDPGGANPVASPEQEVPRVRLDLRLKRPVVTLSIIGGEDTTPAEDDPGLPERVLPFLRAGASVVAGPWWPTSEEADRLFWPAFYERLAGRGASLAEVAWQARLSTEQALGGQLDWLAYAVYGDPLARPYRPVPSEGYVTLECLNPDPDDHLRPGKAYRFRASIRRRPPLGYTDRLVQTEDLRPGMTALFLAPGLQAAPPAPVTMRRAGQALEATIDLTPTQEGEFPLVVQLLEGNEHVKTLQLTLTVGEGLPGGVSDE